MRKILDHAESAILVVDMQKDFCYASGTLFVESSVDIIKKVREVINKGISNDVAIIFTQDWHTPDDSEFSVWKPHCVAGTEGAEIIDEISMRGYVIRKRRYSAFFGTDLDLHLRERGIKKLLFTGVITNICVLHTAADALLREYNVVVLRDCVAALNDYEQSYGLHHLSLLNAEIVNSTDVSFK